MAHFGSIACCSLPEKVVAEYRDHHVCWPYHLLCMNPLLVLPDQCANWLSQHAINEALTVTKVSCYTYCMPTWREPWWCSAQGILVHVCFCTWACIDSHNVQLMYNVLLTHPFHCHNFLSFLWKAVSKLHELNLLGSNYFILDAQVFYLSFLLGFLLKGMLVNF